MPINDKTRKLIAVNVKRLREAKEVSAPVAAKAIGVHRTWWNLLENGTVNFTIDKLEKVAKYLGVDVSALMNDARNGDSRPHNKRKRVA